MPNPTKTMVFGQVYEIEYDKAIQERGALGMCDSEKKVITLDPELKPEMQKQVLLHEELHAVFHRLAFHQAIGGDLEEVLVDSIATFITETYDVARKGQGYAG